MAKSHAPKGTGQVRSSAGSQPQQFPGAAASSNANPSPQPLFYPGGPTSSSAFNPSMNTWRPMYTPAPESLLNFGQFPPIHSYNFQHPPMHQHEQGHQNMENLHFVGASSHDSFSTPPPPPHPKDASRSAPAKVNSSSSKRKRKVINVDDDESGERTAYRLPYIPEEHVRLAGAWLECSLDPIDGNGKKDMSQQVQDSLQNMMKMTSEIEQCGGEIEAEIEQAKEGVADKCRVLEEEKERFQKVALAALNILNGGI